MISLYREKLGLQNAKFLRIDHEDAIVATVYKITKPDGSQLILKICSQKRHYLREVYYLERFAEKLPVPRIMGLVEPGVDVDGAILMECLKGDLLKSSDLSERLLFETGSLLARIHSDRAIGYGGYGDLTQPDELSPDPAVPFTQKFEEGMEECKEHLPAVLLDRCRQYYDRHVDLLLQTDGPCIIHRDFRPGNLLVHQGKLQGIIDWSSGRAGFAEEDFCPLAFGEWFEDLLHKTSFLAGYGSIRTIPDYERVMPFLRLNRAIATIGFTIKRGIWNSKASKLYQFHRQFLDRFSY